MRKLGLIVLTLAFFAATTTFAQLTPKGACGSVRIEGVITAIDLDALQIVVDEQIVQVTDGTVIKKNGRAFAFENLQVGMTVAVCGFVDADDVLVANRITVKYSGN